MATNITLHIQKEMTGSISKKMCVSAWVMDFYLHQQDRNQKIPSKCYMKGGQIDQPKPSIARKLLQSTQENKLVSPRLKRADSDKVTALQKMGVSREKITRRNAKQQLSTLTSNKLKQYFYKTQRKTPEYLRPSYKPFQSPENLGSGYTFISWLK